MKNVLFKHKVGLILFGVVLCFILLEAGLRTGGLILTVRKEHKNKISLSRQADYTILCLGESTTDGEWPPYLDIILNQSNQGITFKVIDKGRGATDTAVILSRLEKYLVEYNPNMVITMMGINDGAHTVRYEDSLRIKTILFLQDFRVYKLAKLLWEHIVYKVMHNKDAYASITISKNTNNNDIQKAKVKRNQKVEKLSESDSILLERESDELQLSGKEYIELGQEYEKQGRYEEAEKMYKKSLQANPKGLYAYLDLGLLYVKQGKYKDAEDIIQQGIEVDPDDAEGYLRLAHCYHKQGRYKDAEEIYGKSLALKSNITYNYILYAECLTEQGKFDEAIATLLKAEKMNHHDERIYLKLGWCYINQQKYSNAEEIFKKAAVLFDKEIHANKGESIFIYYDLGSVYIWQRKYKEAEDIIKEALKIDPNNESGYIRLGWTYRMQKKYKEAQAMLQKGIELSRNDTSPYVHLSRCFLEQNHTERAITILLEAQKVNPHDEAIRSLLDLCYQLQKCEKEYQDNPNDIKVLTHLVQLNSDAHNFNEVERLVLKALESYSDRHAIDYCIMLNLLGLIYLEQGRYNEAEGIYKKAVEINPKDVILYTGLALSYYKRDMYDEVEMMFKKAIELNPKEGKFYSGLGLFYLRQKKYQLARHYFHQAEELGLIYYNSSTYYNYNALKVIVQSSGIQLVCVQYPMQSIAPLKKLLEPYDDIIFVDNEKIFKEAVQKESYNEYFIDSFAGCFGHCTEKGNRLLAQNIAQEILKKCFNK